MGWTQVRARRVTPGLFVLSPPLPLECGGGVGVGEGGGGEGRRLTLEQGSGKATWQTELTLGWTG